ncbi:hypothetical protein V6N13_051066 [Hibiscus sabdariffa]
MYPYLVSIARSQKSISSVLLEKTAHRASIIDEIHLTLTISRYHKLRFPAKLRLSCSEGFRFFPLTDLIAGGTSHPLLAALTIYTLPCLELSRLAQPPALIITIPLLMLFVSSRLVSLTSRTVIKLNYLTSRMTARTTMLFVCNENS